jgi:hypothetical protein
MRHNSHMRELALLLLLPACAAALTPKDESDIRAVIEEQAKADNEKGSDEIWSERGPYVFTVGVIKAVTADVAMADAQESRTGTFFERARYVFIMARTNGRWSIVRKIPVRDGPHPGFQPIGEGFQPIGEPGRPRQRTPGYDAAASRGAACRIAAIRGARLFGLSRLNDRASPNWSRT